MDHFRVSRALRRMFQDLEQREINHFTKHFGSANQPEFFVRLEQSMFYMDFFTSFDTRTIKYINRLIDKKYKPDWHVVDTNPDKSPLELDDWRMIAPSYHEALATVVESMHYSRAKPSKITQTDGYIRIYVDQTAIATIYPLTFSDVTKEESERAKTALKGVASFTRSSELSKFFKRIPGYEVYCPELLELNPTKDSDPCFYLHSKNLCTTLKGLLEKHGCPSLKRSVWQEILANFIGFESWNHLVAEEQQRQASLNHPYFITCSNLTISSDYQWVRYYPDAPSSVYAFGQLLKEHSSLGFTSEGLGKLSFDTIIPQNEQESPRNASTQLLRYDMREVPIVYPEKEFLYLAKVFDDEKDLESLMREYFMSNMEQTQRIIHLNQRKGAKSQDHLFIKDWVYYVMSGKDGKVFAVDPIDDSKVGFENSFRSKLDKSALLKVGNSFWLSTDWDREPTYELEGLDEHSAQKVAHFFNIPIQDG